MTDRVLLVTSPDDILDDGYRLLIVDLDRDQTQFISSVLNQLEIKNTIIVYVWKFGDAIEWLIDKKHKSNYIIFNANSQNQTLVGYLSAQKNSSYLGTLLSLNSVNKSAIISIEQCCNILENRTGK